MPPLRRSSMTARPWLGLWRGLFVALWPRRAAAPEAPALTQGAPWQRAASQRRGVLLVLVIAMALFAAGAQWQSMPDDAGALWWTYSALLVLLLTWLGVGFVTAAMGAWVLWRGDAHALHLPSAETPAPIARGARTAVVMPVCNEDIGTVFSGLRATCESLAATGALALFDFYILSDTSNPALRAAEQRAWAELREMMGDGPGAGRIYYRWRRRRVKRKAGNVADFCRRWGRNYRYMVVLDADSTMHGDTLVSLLRLMEANPRAGILQTLPQPCGHGTLHARAQQFAHRVTGRLFSLGMAYWQLGDSHYWGHNAIIRVEPFMQHCALAKLPGRGGLAGEILSHDFVEAALMSRAGYEVWLVPQLGGSWEQNPPHLLDELQRDRRWCQGNLQNLRLIAEPGWRPVHRALLGTAALSYVSAPLWFAFIALGLALTQPGASQAPSSFALWSITLLLLLLPRVCAVLAVLLLREQASYGGTLRLMGSALLELALSAMQAPLRMLAHSAFVLSALTGLKLEWRSPSRQADGVSWGEAWSRLAMPLLPALLLAVWALGRTGVRGVQAVLLLLPLLLAAPITVASARARFGARIERLGLLWNPDERHPPRTLARAGDTHAFAAQAPRSVLPGMLPGMLPATRPAVPSGWLMGRQRAALAAGVMVVATIGLLPGTGATPELPQWMRTHQDLFAMSTVPPAEPKTSFGEQALLTPVALRERPARRIDEAVRRRAREAVQRALAMDAEEATATESI
jgi:membrane glycosyltransferase